MRLGTLVPVCIHANSQGPRAQETGELLPATHSGPALLSDLPRQLQPWSAVAQGKAWVIHKTEYAFRDSDICSPALIAGLGG